MTAQPETWRAALLMIRQHGPEAAALAALCAAHHFARGDASRMAAWQRIVDAIVELESDRPPTGETLH
ncbi:MAG TPA: hypothetical protein VGF59_17110 [Bryobacteraceae bacterium]